MTCLDAFGAPSSSGETATVADSADDSFHPSGSDDSFRPNKRVRKPKDDSLPGEDTNLRHRPKSKSQLHSERHPGDNTDRSRAFRAIPQGQRACLPSQFGTRVVVQSSNSHLHRGPGPVPGTCTKSERGLVKCRLTFGRPDSWLGEPIQILIREHLVTNPETGTVRKIYVPEPADEISVADPSSVFNLPTDAPDNAVIPFNSPDTRLLDFPLRRRFIDPAYFTDDRAVLERVYLRILGLRNQMAHHGTGLKVSCPSIATPCVPALSDERWPHLSPPSHTGLLSHFAGH